MKKIITTFCVLALTSIVAQAQSKNADAQAAKTQVKKEAPAKLMNDANSDAAKTSEAEVVKQRAEYEEFKKSQQAEAATKASEAKDAPKKRVVNTGETKRPQISDEENRKLETEKKKKKDY